MCTLSLIRGPFSEGAGDELRWRLVFNRDERRARAEAIPPRVHRYGVVLAVHPRDPEGRGTWIAATSTGLVFALLNETEAPGPAVGVGGSPGTLISRGRVIPRLLGAASIQEVETRLRDLPTGRHRPFRLIVVSEDRVLEVVEAGFRRATRHPPAASFMRTSSSVRPAASRLLRTKLFARLVPSASPAAQDRFQAHTWPGAPGASVLMSREDAATVSITTIEAFAHGFRVTYRRWPGGAAAVTEMPRAA
jgi:hypothetical protein